jgi:bla regulator protein blaR1
MSALLAICHALGWALLHSLWIGALVGAVFGLLRAALSAGSSAKRDSGEQAALVQDQATLRHVLGICALLTITLGSGTMFFRAYAAHVAQRVDVNVVQKTHVTPGRVTNQLSEISIVDANARAPSQAFPTPLDSRGEAGKTDSRAGREKSDSFGLNVLPGQDSLVRHSSFKNAIPASGYSFRHVKSGSPNVDSSIWQQVAPMAIATLWLFGVGISAFRLWRSHRTLRTLTRLGIQQPALNAWIATLLDTLALRGRVSVLLSDWIDVPCVIGLLKPIVLLPMALAAQLPREQLELVLLHELSHVKNGDLWVNSAQIVLELLLFFHPVVHWISADVRATRELRCDQSVLGLRAKPVLYAKTLINLEEFRHSYQNLALAASGSANAPASELKQRVQAILASSMSARDSKTVSRSSRAMGQQTQGAMLISVLGFSALSAVLVLQHLPKRAPQEQPQVQVSPRGDTAKLVSPRGDKAKLAAPHGDTAKRRVAGTASALNTLALNTLAVNADMPLLAPADLTDSTTTIALNGPVPVASARPLRVARLRAAAWQAKPVAVSLQSELEPLAPPLPRFLPAEQAVQTALATDRVPALISMVAPEFVAGPRGGGQFRLSFKIDTNGYPTDVVQLSGRASKRQLAAARTALLQWRFEANANAAASGRRFEQPFSFKQYENGHCIAPVGTRICR